VPQGGGYQGVFGLFQGGCQMDTNFILEALGVCWRLAPLQQPQATRFVRSRA
jgi:hypothetical protein